MNYTKKSWVGYETPSPVWAALNNIESGVENAQADNMQLRGAAASKPAASATTVGRLYIETDSPYKVWRDNGAGWDHIGYSDSYDRVSRAISYLADDFVKHPENPVVPQGGVGDWDVTGALDPCVVKDGATYKMWYVGIDPSGLIVAIGLATSPDGINWTKYVGNPVMTRGLPGSYDYNLWEARVIKDGATYKMWYQAAADGSTVYKTNYATSPDGIVWTKHPGNPIFEGGVGKWDQDYAGIRSVIKIGSTYHGFYEASAGGATFAVGYAVSTDGIAWTKISVDSPVLQGDAGEWDDTNLVSNVVYVDGLFVMFYSTRTGTANLGIAVSSDGQIWTKYPNNPVMDMLGAGGAWDDAIGTTLVDVVQDDSRPSAFLLYYRGKDGGVFQIGLIRHDPSATTREVLINADSDNPALEAYQSGAGPAAIFSGGAVGIGTAIPAASAVLEIAGTTGAVLLPRLTSVQQAALTAVNGMVIYNTDNNRLEAYENGAWVDL